ncbi:MAG: FAD-dependent oxidoreductase [Planctomycetota bacterium]
MSDPNVDSSNQPIDGADSIISDGNKSSGERSVVPRGRGHQAFPVLGTEQIERIAKWGIREVLEDGVELFRRGQRRVDFFVVIRGKIEIYDFDCDQNRQVFVIHDAGQFTGEIDLFSNRKVLVGGCTCGTTEVLRLTHDEFQEVLSAEPDIGDIFVRAFIVRRLGILESNLGGSLLIGSHEDRETLAIQSFLRRNGYPVATRYVDHVGDREYISQVFKQQGLSEDRLPAFLCHGEAILIQPTLAQVAEAAGIIERPDTDKVYDMVVVGGGPGGMAAAVYGASEGLSTVVLEAIAPGGQAGTSSKIENYLGFPTGLSGAELAGRAQIQAQKFGAVLALPVSVQGLSQEDQHYRLLTEDESSVCCRSIVIATGAKYRRLGLENDQDFEGRGIHYACTAVEAGLCEGKPVGVVGAGNSAGQAAIYLSQRTEHVHLIVRGDSLAASMSDYLIRRIDRSTNITVHFRCQVCQLAGSTGLREVTWDSQKTGNKQTEAIEHLFLMIGASPNTVWLNQFVALDAKGFVQTGGNGRSASESHAWPLEREPMPFETSLPGIFAIGDVRSGSVKRVASAVGEGSVCVQYIHRHLSS